MREKLASLALFLAVVCGVIGLVLVLHFDQAKKASPRDHGRFFIHGCAGELYSADVIVRDGAAASFNDKWSGRPVRIECVSSIEDRGVENGRR